MESGCASENALWVEGLSYTPPAGRGSSSAGAKAGFGALGAAAGAVIVARLRHHGLLPDS